MLPDVTLILMHSDNLPNMPNLFLADLPPGAVLTPELVHEACSQVRRNRSSWIAARRTRELVELLAYNAEQWLQPDNGFRYLALRDGPAALGFPRTTLEKGLDGFFRLLTVENLEGLITQDLGDVRRLDDFSATLPEMRTSRSAVATGPELLGIIAAGTLPNSTLTLMVLGLLLRSAMFIKCATGTSLVPRLWAHSLAHLEPKIASCIEMVEWPGGTTDLEAALFSEVDVLALNGSDETMASVRSRLPARTRLVPHGHRVSFAYVSSEMLSTYSAGRVARDAATDIAAWNQLGCLSPQVIYVEDHGAVSAEGFAELLAKELTAKEASEPRGELPVDAAATLSQQRSVFSIRESLRSAVPERLRTETVFADVATSVRVLASEGSTAWTVVFNTDPRFELSPGHRFIQIKPVKNLDQALHHADAVGGRVSTVGIAAVDARAVEIARKLATWGVSRVCPIGRMQSPPWLWRHDGRPTLGELVRWTDFET